MWKAKESCPMREVQAWCHKLNHAMTSHSSEKFPFLLSFPAPFLLTTVVSWLACSFSFVPASLPSCCFFVCVHAGTAPRKIPPWPHWPCWSSQKAVPCQLIYRSIPAWTHFRLFKLMWWHPYPLMSPASKKFQYLPHILPQAGEHLLTNSWLVLLP